VCVRGISAAEAAVVWAGAMSARQPKGPNCHGRIAGKL